MLSKEDIVVVVAPLLSLNPISLPPAAKTLIMLVARTVIGVNWNGPRMRKVQGNWVRKSESRQRTSPKDCSALTIGSAPSVPMSIGPDGRHVTCVMLPRSMMSRKGQVKDSVIFQSI